MDLEARLRAFASVARRGSVTAAAHELRITQPAVSHHLASLERHLGTTLVVRDKRGTALTPAGRVLADYVLRAEALLANAARALRSVESVEVGTLSIVSSGIPGTYVLPPLIGLFANAHPGIAVEFQVTTSAPAIDAVRGHRAELGVVGGFSLPPELSGEPLLEDDVVLIGSAEMAAPRHPLSSLTGLTWISREEGSATRAAVDAALWQTGLAPRRRLEMPSWEAVKRAVAQGVGIAAISRFAIDLELAAGRLVVLRVRGWRVRRIISVVHARDVPLSPPASLFLEFLQQRVRRVTSAGQRARRAITRRRSPARIHLAS